MTATGQVRFSAQTSPFPSKTCSHTQSFVQDLSLLLSVSSETITPSYILTHSVMPIEQEN